MKYYQLTENERYQIYALKKAGHSQNEIADTLGRHPSTISRELKRNSGLRGYRPKQAEQLASVRRQQANKYRKMTDEVKSWIEQLIRQELSPQQTVAYLEKHRGIRLHHETVYRYIYQNKARGGALYTHLRIAAKPYRKRYGSYDRRGKIKGRKGIDQRPAVVDRRTRIGDWEGDTIIGKGRKGVLLTLVERKTLYTIIVKLTGKQAPLLAASAINALKPIKERVKTITFDNGLEFAAHQEIAKQLDTNIYFAHPYASWERGINENINGLIRQYFPKDTDLSAVSEAQIQHVMDRINNRPRATRKHCSPNELFMGQQVDLLAA